MEEIDVCLRRLFSLSHDSFNEGYAANLKELEVRYPLTVCPRAHDWTVALLQGRILIHHCARRVEKSHRAREKSQKGIFLQEGL